MESYNRSADRAIDIIELIARSDEAMTLSEVSQALSIPKSTAFDILCTLERRGFLQLADPRIRSYALGLKLFQASAHYMDHLEFHRVAHAVLSDLVARVHETSFLAIESNGELVYLDKIEAGEAMIRTSCNIGSSGPMYCTGVGKALLAAYSEDRVKAIIEQHGIEKKTAWTLATEDTLLNDLQATRERGYSIDAREHHLDIYCVAAPIFNALRVPVAAVSIACFASHMVDNPARVQECGQLISAAALDISHRIGFRGNTLYA